MAAGNRFARIGQAHITDRIAAQHQLGSAIRQAVRALVSRTFNMQFKRWVEWRIGHAHGGTAWVSGLGKSQALMLKLITGASWASRAQPSTICPWPTR